MARELSTPLTADDVTWLQARYPEGYVSRMAELHGVKGKKAKEALSGAESADETGEDSSDGGSAPDGSEDAGDGSEDLIGVANTGDVNTLDLVSPAAANAGGPYDPSAHTADDVVKYLKDASDEEKSRVLAAEAEGKARSTVLNS